MYIYLILAQTISELLARSRDVTILRYMYNVYDSFKSIFFLRRVWGGGGQQYSISAHILYIVIILQYIEYNAQ